MGKTIELKFATSDGANITAYIGAKSKKHFRKKFDKMIKNGCIALGSVEIDPDAVIDMQWRVMEVN